MQIKFESGSNQGNHAIALEDWCFHEGRIRFLARRARQVLPEGRAPRAACSSGASETRWSYLSDLAVTRGTSLNDLVNALLKEEIERLDGAK
jgi:hypothetical protein